MFFSISKQADTRFPNNYVVGELVFNCDNGWTVTTTSAGIKFSKGYCDGIPVTSVEHNNQHLGNFCIVDFNQEIRILHNRDRSFPIWINKNSISNLYSDKIITTQVWADQLITADKNLKVSTHSLISEHTTITSTVDTAVDNIKQILDTSVANLNISEPIHLFCSLGIDTGLLYSLLKYHQVKTIPTISTHYEEDYFTKTNQERLNQLWAYRQIHHWIAPSIIATGSHGDEYFLRGPATVGLITAWHNIDFLKLLKPTDYHYYYFLKYQQNWENFWNQRKEIQAKYPSESDLHQQVINILSNDHQHWHLGNTITWTPFKNIDIIRHLLGCPIDQLLSQFTNAEISKQLIARYDSNVLNYISNFKNHPSNDRFKKLELLTQDFKNLFTGN